MKQALRRPQAPPVDGRRATVGFLLRFVVGWIIALLVLSAFPVIEDWAVRHTTHMLTLALGVPAPLPGGPQNLLRIGDRYWAIVPDCTPLMSLVTLSVAIMAFPCSAVWKLLGIAAGAAVLWLFNLTRLVLLSFVETWVPAASALVHVYVFQTVTFVLVCLLFVLWANLQARRGNPQARSR